jgi:hypothetical protein
MDEWTNALKAEPLRRLFAATELETHSSHVVFPSQTQNLLQEVEVNAKLLKLIEMKKHAL